MARAKTKGKVAPETASESAADSGTEDRILKPVLDRGGRTYKPKNKQDRQAFKSMIGDGEKQISPERAQALADKGVIQGYGTTESEKVKAFREQEAFLRDEDRKAREAAENEEEE